MGKSLFILWMFLPSLLLHSQTTAVHEDRESIHYTIDSLQRLLRSAKEDTTRVNRLYELGLQLNKLNQNEDLLQYGAEANLLSRKLNYKRGVGLSGYLTSLYYYHQANYSQAVKDIFMAMGILEEAGDLQGVGRCTALIANIFYFQGKNPESIQYFLKTLKILEATKDRAAEARIYNSLGRGYCDIGDLSRGLENYYKALQISEELGDKTGMANSLQYVGAIFMDYNDDSLALKNISTALELNLETGNRFGYAQNNTTIGDIYLRQGKFLEGLNVFRASLKIYEEPGAPAWGIPWCYASMGNAFEYLGDSAMGKGNRPVAKAFYEEALKHYHLSLEKYKELEIRGALAEEYLYIGVISIKLNRIPDAKKYIQSGLQLFKELGSKEKIGNAYFYLSRIDSLEGNYENAHRHLSLSNLYRDSVFNSAESRKIALFKTQYEIEKKEREIKLLASENALKTTIAEKQKQQKLFAYAIILLVVLLSSYAFYRYRNRKKAEVEQAKLKDRLHISQGLHDDIGSTLSSISVYTQVAQKLSEKNNKEELKEMLGKINMASFEMISEMNDIVWAIHPKNDSMEKIILRMESYARPMLMTKNILFKLENDPVILSANLEMEKRKNFYLVFKEAVNNAFKYSGCSEIITRIAISAGFMEMQVIDNGVGFNVQKEMTGDKLTLTGNGLRNMKMRAEIMNGDLQISSVAGRGTTVRLSIPIP